MKKTEKSGNGTSFHNITITTTINELTKVLGEPTDYNNSGEDKVNVEWICENKNGQIVTIYDWKEYRSIGLDEKIIFHLGGMGDYNTLEGKRELHSLLGIY